MRKSKVLVLGAIILGLAGCGDTVGKQSIYGAAAGAAVAEAAGGNWALGALIGSAANVFVCDQVKNNC